MYVLLTADEIPPAKVALKTKVKSYGGLDKLKARVCLRGDMQIKDDFNSWSLTASIRLLKCFIIICFTLNKVTVYYLDLIQAFIQSDVKKRQFDLLDKEYKQFCPKVAKYFGPPMRLKKYLCGANFSDKTWYEILNKNLRIPKIQGRMSIYPQKGPELEKLMKV